MFKKFFIVLLIVSFIFLESCGTILKYKYIQKPVTNKLDWSIVTLDGIGIILLIVPGIVALTIDYMTGTIFLPASPITFKDLPLEDIEKVLNEHNVHVQLTQLKGVGN